MPLLSVQTEREETKMTLKPLPGFKSLTTHHCVTGSMCLIYEFHGYPISEDLLLGLGTGVGFVYWHMKGTPPLEGGPMWVGQGKKGWRRPLEGTPACASSPFRPAAPAKRKRPCSRCWRRVSGDDSRGHGFPVLL